MEPLDHAPRTGSKGYIHFALGTIVVSLIVAVVAGSEVAPLSPAKVEAPAVERSGAKKAPRDDTPAYNPWALNAPRAESGRTGAASTTGASPGEYEIASAVEGARESEEEAAAAGRAPRELASPEQVRALVEASRERSGRASGARDSEDESGLLP